MANLDWRGTWHPGSCISRPRVWGWRSLARLGQASRNICNELTSVRGLSCTIRRIFPYVDLAHFTRSGSWARGQRYSRNNAS
jgi:hypothetical protein